MKTKRNAFTLIEMLVAMALTLFVMVIISQAFVTALETFSGLKGIGDLQYNLRTATSLLQSDLAQDHFEARRRLSDPNIVTETPREGFFFVRLGPTVSEGNDADGMPCLRAPLAGKTSDALYFTIKMRGNTRERFLTHRLPATPFPPPLNPPPFPPLGFFAVSPLTDPQYPRGNAVQGLPNFLNQPPDAIFQDDGNQLTYCSQWFEVVWYLLPTGTTDELNNPLALTGTPLYALH